MCATRRRNSLGDFEIIVHIEASACDVEVINLDAFLLRSIHPLAHYLLVVIVKNRHIVLLHIPRLVGMIVVLVHSTRR
jgi:hypothetical protein